MVGRIHSNYEQGGKYCCPSMNISLVWSAVNKFIKLTKKYFLSKIFQVYRSYLVVKGKLPMSKAYNCVISGVLLNQLAVTNVKAM